MPARLVAVTAWSDLQAAGGVARDAVWPWTSLATTTQRDGDDRLTGEIARSATGATALVAGEVLRLERADASVEEWIVQSVDDRLATDRIAVTALPARVWTAERVIVRSTADFSLSGTALLSVAIDALIALDEWPSWLIRGTISRDVSVAYTWTNTNPLAALLALVAAANATDDYVWYNNTGRLVFRRVSATQYAVDILTTATAGTPTIIEAKNILSLATRIDRAQIATTIYPVNASGAGMGEAYVECRAAAANVLQLRDWSWRPDGMFIAFDGQWVGDFAIAADGTGSEITASNSTTQEVTVVSSAAWGAGSNNITRLARPSQPSLSDPIAATGGTVTTSGKYTVHTFTADGTFTVTSPGIGAELLLVGGGGGGGRATTGTGAGGSGGGGGGGQKTTTGLILVNGAYSVVVGAGGAAAPTNGQGSDGAGSSALGYSVSGGGGGGYYGGGAGMGGRAGGSGGGAAGNNTTETGGTGVAGEGYAGGDPGAGVNGGGGGGASAVGAGIGTGGAGAANSYSGSGVTRSGGGGGGITGSATYSGGLANGGSGGGGSGTYWEGDADIYTNAVAGTANTGGGGGGGYRNGPAAAGGTGVVIIRYLTTPNVAALSVRDTTVAYRKAVVLAGTWPSGINWCPNGQWRGWDTSTDPADWSASGTCTCAQVTGATVETGTYALAFSSTSSTAILESALGQIPTDVASPNGGSQTWVLGMRVKRTAGAGTLTLQYAVNATPTWVTAASSSGSAAWETVEGTFVTDATTIANLTRVRLKESSGSASTYHVDRVWLFRQGVDDASNTLEGCGPLAGLFEANHALLARRTAGSTYELGVMDRYRDDPTAFPDDKLEVGQMARLIAPTRSLDTSLELVGVGTDELHPLNTTVQVGALRRRLTDRA